MSRDETRCYLRQIVRESEVAQLCPTLCDPIDCKAYNTPLSMGFSRQEYWSGLPFSSPEDLPNPGIEPRSPTLKADAYHLSHQGNLLNLYREGEKNITLVCFLLLLKREIKISDTCSLFPLFGDPWPSCLFPSHCVYVMYIRHTNNNIKNITKFKVK